MRHRIFLLSVFVISLSNIGKATAQDGASHFANDSSKFSWPSIPSFIGGDLFLSGEIYGLHLSGAGSLTAGAGPGAEIRIHPAFIGAAVGFCGDEGIPYLHAINRQNSSVGHYPTTYSFYLVYAGVVINEYRLAIGAVHGDNTLWVTKTPEMNYTTTFMGISRRCGHIFFFEPEVKVMFPVVAHYSLLPLQSNMYTPITARFSLRDLYFAFSVKLGIGFN